MRSLHQFIVKPVGDKRYNNTKEIGGIDFIVSTSEEDFKSSNRHAEVVEVPISYNGEISKGDILLVHHNVFKFYNDMRGRRRSGKSFFKDNLFFLDADQFFAYKKDDVWKGYDRYCFVRPIDKEESYIYKPFTHEPLMGEVVIANSKLKSYGIESGQKVSFKPDSEYEFIVDDETLYRMYDHQITMTV